VSEANRSGRPSVYRLGALLLVSCLWLFSGTGVAQVLYGSVVGNIKDASGASIPGATVTITNKATSLTRDVTTSPDGSYSIVNVLPGTYDVKVALQGFRESVKTDVPVSAGTISRVDMTLEVGQLSETVTVASPVQLLQTDKADVHTELKAREITNLPLPAYRNYQSLLNLVPGATPAVLQNSLTDTPGRSLRTFVNGQNPNTNMTKSDGATNVNLWLPHHTMYVAPAETIESVNVSTDNFDAEQGMAGGAAITLVTKSGTNSLKGSAFEFFNGDSLNARKFFDPSVQPSKKNIVGGTLGGPISRDKVFFFGSYEGYFERTTQFDFYDVPTAAMRSGDFSATSQIIYNPFTGDPATGLGRQAFTGNIIPQTMLDPIAQKVVAFYPLPNTGAPGAISRNFVRQDRVVVDRHNFDAKVNWNRTSAHQIWAKYSELSANVGNLFYLGVDGGGNGDTKVYQPTVGQTWTLSPTLILDSTFGFSRQKQNVQASDFNLGNIGTDVFGIPGTNGSDPRYAGFPQFQIGPTGALGFSNLGNSDGWNPLYRDERTYNFTTNLTKIVGNHDIRFGYSMNHFYMDHWQPEIGNPRGQFIYNGTATALAASAGGQTPNAYNQFAQFLLGLNTSAGRSIQYELMTAREWQHGFFVRDRWQVNAKSTLDLGLRYEYYPLMHRANRGIEQVDLSTMTVLLGGVGGNPENLNIHVSKTLFAPRLGYVYRLNDDTVFRTGYGLTYNPLPFSRPLRGYYPLTLASNNTTTNTFGWFDTLAQGIPPIIGPDESTGRFPLPNNVDERTPENDLTRGHIQSWNVTIERRLPADISTSVAYVGTAGDGGFADLDINASDTPGGGDASRPYFAQFGRKIALNSWGPRVKTRYHSLQIAVNRPLKAGLLLKGAYTFSKSMGMTTSGEDGWVGLDFNAPSQYARNYARQAFDRPHVFQMGFLYELPFGKGEGNKAANMVIKDWQLNGIFAAYSGLPFTITATNGTSINMPGNLQTANQIAPFNVLGNIGNDGKWFDTSAFVQPTGVVFGNTGRYEFRGPSAWNLDLSLFRNFPFGSRRIEFRAEGFNILNHARFNNPNSSVTSSTYGQIFQLEGNGTALTDARTIRLGVRFQF
jgi:hypothetical protein